MAKGKVLIVGLVEAEEEDIWDEEVEGVVAVQLEEGAVVVVVDLELKRMAPLLRSPVAKLHSIK